MKIVYMKKAVHTKRQRPCFYLAEGNVFTPIAHLQKSQGMNDETFNILLEVLDWLLPVEEVLVNCTIKKGG